MSLRLSPVTFFERLQGRWSRYLEQVVIAPLDFDLVRSSGEPLKRPGRRGKKFEFVFSFALGDTVATD